MTLYAVVRKGTDRVMSDLLRSDELGDDMVSNPREMPMVYYTEQEANRAAEDIKSYDTSPDFQVEVREGEFKIK